MTVLLATSNKQFIFRNTLAQLHKVAPLATCKMFRGSTPPDPLGWLALAGESLYFMPPVMLYWTPLKTSAKSAKSPDQIT